MGQLLVAFQPLRQLGASCCSCSWYTKTPPDVCYHPCPQQPEQLRLATGSLQMSPLELLVLGPVDLEDPMMLVEGYRHWRMVAGILLGTLGVEIGGG
jgi:hypothetical protein